MNKSILKWGIIAYCFLITNNIIAIYEIPTILFGFSEAILINYLIITLVIELSAAIPIIYYFRKKKYNFVFPIQIANNFVYIVFLLFTYFLIKSRDENLIEPYRILLSSLPLLRILLSITIFITVKKENRLLRTYALLSFITYLTQFMFVTIMKELDNQGLIGLFVALIDVILLLVLIKEYKGTKRINEEIIDAN